MKIVGLDHIQLAMPKDAEANAIAYYNGILGLGILQKPVALQGRGGVWFSLPDERQVHLGVEDDFRPNKKAHPAFQTQQLDHLAQQLETEHYLVKWDTALAPLRRFYSADPFGNRLEFIEL